MMGMLEGLDRLAVLFQGFGLIGAIKEFPLEQLNCNNSKNEHEEDVNDEDVQHVLQRVDHTVKHRLRTQKIHILHQHCTQRHMQYSNC